FNLFFNDAACVTPTVQSVSVPVAGNGDYVSPGFVVTAAGTYRYQARYNGDSNNLAVGPTACTDPAEAVTVIKAPPSLTTLASAPVGVGGTIQDTATLSGGFNPTGSIIFNVFGPGDPNCGAAPVFTATVPVVNGNNNYTSPVFTVTPAMGAGVYRFQATYSGDANNGAVGPTACSDPLERVPVNPVSPLVSTTASASVPVGGVINDSAILTNGAAPTGTITFTLFGPNNAACAGAPIFTSTVPVTGNGTYSPPVGFTTVSAGTYRFVASYSGDANNNPVTTLCTDPAEAVVVTPFGPTITTTVSSPVGAVGTPFHDTATLAGGNSPTGTITFNLYGPGDATCAGPPVFSPTVPVTGNGSYQSGDFTPAAPGIYRFRATYNGDPNNAATLPTSCTDPAEQILVPALPTLTTVASGTVPVGGNIHDTATLAGGITPTGTITINLYGPTDPNCGAAPLSVSTITVTGNGSYNSTDFTTTQAGTYRYRASYSGDANNAGVPLTPCSDPAEDVVVTPLTPLLSTTASGSGPLGGAVSDSAILSGGAAPTGTITFRLYGPDDVACANPPIFTSMATVTGNATYPSGPFTPLAAGTYRFVATYGGDANNAPAATLCTDPAEAVVLTKGGPTIATTASPSVALGAPIHDTATLTGGTAPTGTITFRLYGPDDTTCTGPVVFTAPATVSPPSPHSPPPPRCRCPRVDPSTTPPPWPGASRPPAPSRSPSSAPTTPPARARRSSPPW
ncbi:MAG: hypothetical protein LC708_02425, partial [Actinobacteria bacterium]|nr:hypothetical protein [Actinomycetota bacterium]